jgi:hypothetical protein
LDGDADAAVAAVRRRAAQLLRALPTSVDEDDAALAAAGADAEAAAPVRLRRVQKLLLHELLDT